ncbi:MAG: hypothetical protein JNL75_00190 [Chitinophagales bacterium]|nr:hypothetical protein [Chitinophagales bacterium]
MRFSQRIGQRPASKKLQLEEIDSDLRNSLWNVYTTKVTEQLGYKEFTSFKRLLWISYFKKPVDYVPDSDSQARDIIRDYFFKCDWYDVYDFIEFVANIDSRNIPFDQDLFKEYSNYILEREYSAYRFIDNQIVPISNTEEVKELEAVINNTDKYSALSGANIHIKNSIDKISDKKNPDYRNSIKESISAVESVAKSISDNKKDSLAGALDKIKSKTNIHSALERGFKQIYGYTSDSEGIRHALMDEDEPSFEDAKFMLVSCSAFVNYLIAKAEKNSITLNK